MKTIMITLLLSSFVFSGVRFTKSIGYSGLDATVTVMDAMGVDFDLNDKMSIGYDTGGPGLLVKTPSLKGSTVRIGWNNTAGTSTLGVGYDWELGGSENGIGTSLGTSLDYTSDGTDDETTLRINISWGF